MSLPSARAKVALTAVLLLGIVGVAACADAYLGVNEPPPGEEAGTSEGGPNPVPTDAAGTDGARPPENDASPAVDAGTVTFMDDFDRPDGAVRGPWDSTSTRNGSLSLVPSGALGESGRRLRAQFAEPPDGGSAAALVSRKYPYVLLTGKATFALKVDEFEANTDGGPLDAMHMFAVEFPCAGGINHIVRAGLRKRSTGFAIFTVSQYIPGSYRASDDSALRLTTGRIYQISIDYDATAPAAGKPIATISVDGMVAASVDGTAETAITHTTSTSFSTGGQSGYGASWTLNVDDFKVVARP